LALQEIKFRRILGFLSWHSKTSNSEEFLGFLSWHSKRSNSEEFWEFSLCRLSMCVCVCVWASMCVLRWFQMLGNQGGQF
jgi:hypothetical protein